MQTRWQSLIESNVNILIGMVISYTANITILPLFFNETLTNREYGSITLIFTLLSLIRSYTLRRLFNKLHNKREKDKL